MMVALGGKSTISSLTTSSNQEWMATNDAAAAAAKQAGVGGGDVKPSSGENKTAAENVTSGVYYIGEMYNSI